ncbi:MAG: DUF2304 family protein [Eubacterium sp.]|jgi:hypothetical protein|nr:DUF2304 family protein [Eubacterium sp.]NBI85980.1 DUF2304 domain-containing protein [Lachnospiraceae bacterium]
MSIKIQIIVAALVVLALLFIANMVRKETLDIRFALSWLTVGGVVLVLDLFPGIMNYLVHLLGIELPVNMMFFFGFCFTLLLLFSLTVKVSRQAEQLKRLTQEIALLEERMENQAGAAGFDDKK